MPRRSICDKEEEDHVVGLDVDETSKKVRFNQNHRVLISGLQQKSSYCFITGIQKEIEISR